MPSYSRTDYLLKWYITDLALELFKEVPDGHLEKVLLHSVGGRLSGF